MTQIDMQPFIDLIGCDTARILKPGGRMFLLVGYKRNTANSPDGGAWFKNGQRMDFDYTEEHTVASGETVEELMRSAKDYALLKGLTWQEFFDGKISDAQRTAVTAILAKIKEGEAHAKEAKGGDNA